MSTTVFGQCDHLAVEGVTNGRTWFCAVGHDLLAAVSYEEQPASEGKLTVARNGDMYAMFDVAYPASKTAVNPVTTMLARELRDAGNKVAASIPGYVKTDLNGGPGMISAAVGVGVTVALALVATNVTG